MSATVSQDSEHHPSSRAAHSSPHDPGPESGHGQVEHKMELDFAMKPFVEGMDIFAIRSWFETYGNYEEFSKGLAVESPHDKFTDGKMIIDGLKINIRELRKFVRAKNKDLAEELFQTCEMKALGKGGIYVDATEKICDQLAEMMHKASKKRSRDNKFENVNCHVPRRLQQCDERAVVIYDVPTTISEKRLRCGLLPPCDRVERFLINGQPSPTCKVIYHSVALAERVAKEKKVLLNEVQYLSARRFRRKKPRFCKTCKKPWNKCVDKSRCSNLRCGVCGEKHQTKNCPENAQEFKCIECGGDHKVFSCPKLSRKVAHEQRMEEQKER